MKAIVQSVKEKVVTQKRLVRMAGAGIIASTAVSFICRPAGDLSEFSFSGSAAVDSQTRDTMDSLRAALKEIQSDESPPVQKGYEHWRDWRDEYSCRTSYGMVTATRAPGEFLSHYKLNFEGSRAFMADGAKAKTAFKILEARYEEGEDAAVDLGSEAAGNLPSLLERGYDFKWDTRTRLGEKVIEGSYREKSWPSAVQVTLTYRKDVVDISDSDPAQYTLKVWPAVSEFWAGWDRSKSVTGKKAREAFEAVEQKLKEAAR